MGVIKATVWVLLKQLGVIKACMVLLKQLYGCYVKSNCMGVIKATVWVLLKQLYGCY